MYQTNAIALGLLLATTSVVTGTEVDTLKERIIALENNKPTVEFSGVIEVGYEEDRVAGKIEVETVELGIAANLGNNLNANLVLLSEVANGKLPTDDMVDEATLNGNVSNIGFSVGKFTAPFGVYETAMISDPAGLDIGETGGVKALVLSTQMMGITLTAWGSNHSNNGFGVSYKSDNFTVGVDIIHDALGVDAETTQVKNKGVAIHGQVSWSDMTVIAEQITIDNDIANEAKNKEKQLEVQYAMNDWIFAAKRDGGDTKSTAYSVGYVIAEGVNLTIESNKPKDATSKTLAKLTYEF